MNIDSFEFLIHYNTITGKKKKKKKTMVTESTRVRNMTNTFIAGDKHQFLDLFMPFFGLRSASWRQLKRAVVT